MRDKGIFIYGQDELIEGEKYYNPNTGKQHCCIKDKSSNLTLEKKGVKPTLQVKKEIAEQLFEVDIQESTSKGEKLDKCIAGLVTAAIVEEHETPAVVGGFTRRGARNRGFEN